MHVGLGLPVSEPEVVLEWAVRAERASFSTVALLDRLVYDNTEPLITLAAIAGATSRVRLQTEVLLAPLHRTAVLAKQAATLDRLSGGRFTLGIGVGGRQDDHDAARVDIRTRGRRLDEQMDRMRAVWAGEGGIGPAPSRPGGPEVLFGGFADVVVERVARVGDGFLGAGAPPHALGRKFDDVRAAWTRHGRDGAPKLVGQVNVVLGPDAVVDRARAEIGRYYAFTSFVEHVQAGLLTTPEQVREALTVFDGHGTDEVVLFCWSPDLDQVERLADVVG